jgi:integrase
VVQEVLGHSTIMLTLDTYSHVAPGMDAEAAKKMDSLFAADRVTAVGGSNQP